MSDSPDSTAPETTPAVEAAQQQTAAERAAERWGPPQVLGTLEGAGLPTAPQGDPATPAISAEAAPPRFPDESERLKRAKLVELLEEGVVSLGVWPFVDGVDVPAPLKINGQIVLHVGGAINHEILELEPLGLRVMLSFNKHPRLCFLPWASIWNMRANQPHNASGPLASPCPACGGKASPLWDMPPKDEPGAPPVLVGMGCPNHGGVHGSAFFGAPSRLICDTVAAWEEGRPTLDAWAKKHEALPGAVARGLPAVADIPEGDPPQAEVIESVDLGGTGANVVSPSNMRAAAEASAATAQLAGAVSARRVATFVDSWVRKYAVEENTEAALTLLNVIVRLGREVPRAISALILGHVEWMEEKTGETPEVQGIAEAFMSDLAAQVKACPGELPLSIVERVTGAQMAALDRKEGAVLAALEKNKEKSTPPLDY